MDKSKWHEYNGETVYAIYGSPSQTVMFTSSRFIFLKRDAKALFERGKKYSNIAKEEGGGTFMKILGFVVGATGTQTEADYLEVSPDDAMAQNPDSFAIQNSDVKKLVFRKHKNNMDANNHVPVDGYVELHTKDNEKYKFTCDCNDDDIELFNTIFSGICKEKGNFLF